MSTSIPKMSKYDYDYGALCGARGSGLLRALSLSRGSSLPDAKPTKNFDTVVSHGKRRAKLSPHHQPLSSLNEETGMCIACRRLFDGTGDPGMDLMPREQQRNGRNQGRKKKEGSGQVLDSYAHRDPFWLRRSAQKGCPLCFVVWNRLRRQTFSSSSSSSSSDFEGWEFVGGRCKILEYWQVEGEVETLPLISYFAGIRLLVGAGKGMGEVRNFAVVTINLERVEGGAAVMVDEDEGGGGNGEERDGASTWSGKSIAQLERWLRSCCESHTCKPGRHSKGDGFLPKRLLHVGTDDTPKLHLVEGDQLAQDTRYATLSHCWGDPSLPRPYLLFENKLQAMQRNIAAADLPKTFSEAVSVIQRLGIEYIWIDSLCIMQDSKNDWERHAAIMWKVYSHSHLNISASASLDPSQGLFRPRHPASIADTIVEVPATHDFVDKGRYTFYDDQTFREDVDKAPVNTRAWVFQERLLSPRVVHFCEGQLYWECQSLQASERFPAGFPERVRRSKQRAVYKAACGRNVDEKEFLYAWGKLVDMYTSCDLTYGSDKLPAISASAKNLQQTTAWQGEYLAGLWEHRLIDQLLWSAHGRALRTKEYRAPSWSWASMDGPVRADFNCYAAHAEFPFNTDYSRHLAKVIDAWTESEGDRFMSVSHGRLHLRAPVWCVSLWPAIDRTGRDYAFNFPGQLSDTKCTVHVDEVTDYTSLSGMDLFFAPVLCLPGTNHRTGLEDGAVDRLAGLVLTPKKMSSTVYSQGLAPSEGETAVFTRVGVASMGEDKSAHLLCELGNQEVSGEERLSCLTRSDERLRLDEFAPSNWFLRDLEFIPRDHAMYDLFVE